MKKLALFLAFAGFTGGVSVHSQAPEPAPTAPPAAAVPDAPPGTPGALILQLQAIRDQNAKLIEQQTATLKQLEEMEKAAQQLKFFGKRS